MAVFTKEILRPGTYFAPGTDGKKRPVQVTRKKLDHFVSQFEKMKSGGLKVPAPWLHDKRARPYRTRPENADKDSYKNAGWWDELWVDEDTNSLMGRVKVPRRSDSSRVGTTVKEVSPLISEEWIDGDGDTYADALTHIALVTHPVMKNQENFEPVENAEQDVAIAMSMMAFSEEFSRTAQTAFSEVVADPGQEQIAGSAAKTTASDATVDDACAILKELGMSLPDDTTAENFVERIVAAGIAIRSAKEMAEEEQAAEDPAMIQNPPGGIAMSQGASSDQTLTDGQTAALAWAQKLAKKSYRDRIQDLVNTGRITAATANDTLAPLLSEDIQFSNEGEPISGNLDVILKTLEEVPAGAIAHGMTKTQIGVVGEGTEFSLTVEDPPAEAEFKAPEGTGNRPEPTEEEAVDIVARQFKNTGRDRYLKN